MIGRPRDILGRVQVFSSVALALIPLALTAHYHDFTSHERASNPCALCVVAQHIPAVKSAVQPSLVPILQPANIPTSHTVPPTHVFRPFHDGRAPPLGSPPLA